MKRLGINIDHVATLRNARGENHPSPILTANYLKKKNVDSVTIHLREDRRHINDLDAKNLFNYGLNVNLEISTKEEIVKQAIKIKPNYICIVPENRKEITEGGLNLNQNKSRIKSILKRFKN